MKKLFFTLTIITGCLTAFFTGNSNASPLLVLPPDCTICPLDQCTGGTPSRPPGLISTARNNYGDEAVGAAYDLDLKPAFLIEGHHLYLGFDLAYTFFPGRHDSLQILISMDCGNSWETLFAGGGKEICTAPLTDEYFIPAPDQWKNYRFDLGTYTGTAKIRIRFFNGNGNNLYLDNLGFHEEITATKSLQGQTGKLYPNPFKGSALLQFDETIKDGTLVIMDGLGHALRQIENIEGNQMQVSSEELNPGMYWYNLVENGKNKYNGKFIISN